MKFLQTYKRLDNLCRDMNGTGVTGYLEDMERLPDGERFVPGWKEDYDQLKHYRYLRNRIVHEVNADEDDLCSAADVAWLENFYGRILGTNDPLALCRKARTAPSGPDPRLLYRMGATPPSAADPQAPYRGTSVPPSAAEPLPYSRRTSVPPPPAAERPALSSPKTSRPSIYSAYSDENKRFGPARPTSSSSAPHTGCALWLLFAFCIALFFLSEFFR